MEGQKTYVEKINITGNVKTKDKVIRRELAISPGEVFDMVRVKISKQRLEGLNYFEKVDTDPAPTDPPISGHKNLDVAVTEKNTGNLTFGAGFSSVDSLVGFVEMTQGNFDLFHPPTFTGAGEKLRLKLALGTERQDYELSFIEPWFLNRKLVLGVDLYRHQLDFESPNDIYDETRIGRTREPDPRVVERLFASAVSATRFEQVGISLNSPYHVARLHRPQPAESARFPIHSNVPQSILEQLGAHNYNRFGTTLAYDTRNSTQLPNHGQRSEIDPEISVGDTDYYKIELRTSWYFPGLMKGHVIEAVGRGGIADSLNGGDVPFYDAYYLGGLYSLRGFKYRNVSPRDPPTPGVTVNEPIGGDSYLVRLGGIQHSDRGKGRRRGRAGRHLLTTSARSAKAPPPFREILTTTWAFGLRLNIPHMGPLRLDYGMPITHDQYNGGSGQFQFGAGYTRQF